MDFVKIFASAGTASAPTDAQYLQGFEFLGSAPPTIELFNSMFQIQDLKMKALHDANATLFWQASTPYAVGDVRLPSDFDHRYLECTVAGTSGTVEPTCPAVGSTVTDGGVTWIVRDFRVATETTDNSTRISTTAWIRTNIQSLVSGCIAAVATAAGFAYSFGSIGYLKFPSWLGGVIIQWGNDASASTYSSTAYPVVFPNTVYQVLATVYQVSGGSAQYVAVIQPGPTTTGFNLTKSAALSCNWIAVGR